MGLSDAQADFTFTHSGDLTAVFDTGDPEIPEQDTLGLDGASFIFTATFPNSPYIDLRLDGLTPALYATSAFLTISGASVASTNGTYPHIITNSGSGEPIFMIGGSNIGGSNEGAIIDSESNNATWAVGVGNVSIPTGAYRGGDNLGTIGGSPTLANFPTHVGFSANASALDFTAEYSISNGSISTTVTAVPEPSAFLCVGLIGLGLAMRKKRKQQ